MSISNYNLTGDQKHNINHFAGVVKLAMADGTISEGEEKLLKRIAKNLHILEEKYDDILENYVDYPVTTPHNYDDRIELLYDYARMIFADDSATGDEAKVLRKICVGLGFPTDNVDKVSDEAIHLVMNDNDLEDFNKAIKYVNRI
ncbi:TerB family tellurite resistance protein [Lutibacter sp. TH_r2]|uniref:tellurite resistance TerB family protein n=1 Tax=Lutibacter sp. TH_r2 TaxID=3082083 RepID=UPI0029556FE0|nr:TerB family tellurite resistance protein [Lutibacter sp. TH_r2]MDV7186477.1 TerB family tellurite resistance protein [Lutibacter sp. TH_r2]